MTLNLVLDNPYELGWRDKVKAVQESNGLLSEILENTHVHGDCSFMNLKELYTIPDGFVVDGTLDLLGCVNLEILPKRLVVGKNLDLGGCFSLKSLPKDLSVGGYISTVNSGITSIPKTIKCKKLYTT